MNAGSGTGIRSGMRERSLHPAGLSDEALLQGMGLGDRAAAAAFVRRFQSRVYGLALSVLHDPSLAEDVAQEALIKAWRHAGAYDPRRGSVATWLLTVTRNLAIDALRFDRARPAEPSSLAVFDAPSEDPGPADTALRDDAARDVREAVARLPVEQRRALVLSAFFGRTAQEVAELEGIPLGTAKTRIRSGMLKLRGLLDQGSVAG